MVVFDNGYQSAMDSPMRAPANRATPWDNIERPLIPIRDIGKTVTEGRAAGGTFMESVQAAIREGTGQLELSTQMEGQEPRTGAESYGKEAREELRDMARVNQVKITSVHAPTQVGNVSGFAGPERGFINEQRELQVNEIRKAIEFAADVATGEQATAIVFHTGEFHRPMTEADWNKDKMFKTYMEEQERAVVPLVDRRTGHVIQQVRKNQPIARPKWLRAEDDYTFTDPGNGEQTPVKKGEYVDYFKRPVGYEGRVPVFNSEKGRFETELWTWEQFEQLARERNVTVAAEHSTSVEDLNPDLKVTPEEMFLETQVETNERQARGWALFHSSRFDDTRKLYNKLLEARKWYVKLEENIPEEEKWRIKQVIHEMGGNAARFLGSEEKYPTEILDKEIRDLQWSMEHIREGSVGYEMQAREQKMLRNNAVSTQKYALRQSAKSMAEAGLFALDVTQQKGLDKPIFIAPENVWPEMGYGSHPDEIIHLIKLGRDKMVEYLTADKIEDPSMVAKDPETGEIRMVDNPYKRSGISKPEAQKLASDHIRMTLDTQHLGMWWRYFQKEPGETEAQAKERFNGWYMEQMKKLVDTDTVGYVHLVDGWGRGHTHLPAGEGSQPVVTAIEYLKKRGFTGSINSEGFGEPGRQLSRTWAAFGSPIYSSAVGSEAMSAPNRWGDVWQSYMHRPPRTPYYVFGAYSPSEDWTLWSGVQME
ncbi:hypothetical protein COY28_02195 [Candidatus Woesearchaeota archaeon CG_4_10_14_0_2_um_filter_57_5]|nr:MAG: hypothetical protein AUJ68_06000 [Candidatus Woesearchaeota archaeon CG1_02_57_44]PIN68309.1 MAG: hypothetical protein COV94_05370 [Candidatus Woesearchaeota archaeon CG11_big_fil_rev_8_21_14_0_20_57_5]PIZ54967.1 MAG: hypothetical protein COY28_02195 [Candidatus Woesearchaeota archaeon CG_4_10_14_0_2_um_filter_57_5]